MWRCELISVSYFDVISGCDSHRCISISDVKLVVFFSFSSLLFSPYLGSSSLSGEIRNQHNDVRFNVHVLKWMLYKRNEDCDVLWLVPSVCLSVQDRSQGGGAIGAIYLLSLVIQFSKNRIANTPKCSLSAPPKILVLHLSVFLLKRKYGMALWPLV